MANNFGFVASPTSNTSNNFGFKPNTPSTPAQVQGNPLDGFSMIDTKSAPSPAPIETAVKNTIADYHNAIPSFLEAAGSGDAKATDLGPDGKPIGDFTANARNVAVGALRATASGIGTIFSPITNAIQSASDSFAQNAKDPLNSNKPLTDNPVVSKVLDLFSGANHTMNTWATKNPEQAKNLQSAITIALTAAGGGENGLDKPVVAGDFPTTIQGLKELPSDIKNTLTKGIQTISDATKTGINTVKDTVFGTPEEQALQEKNSSIAQSTTDTMPLQSKDVRIDELRNTFPDSQAGNGGVTREGLLGKSTPQPTAQDIARGTVADEYIKNASDPIEKIANVNQGIKDTSIKTDEFLDKNSSPANFADMRKYIESNNKPPLNITQDSTAFESYNRSNENALNTLYKTMKESATKSGDFGSTPPGSDIRQARIAVDQQITKELGEEVFGTPQYKGIKAAEINVRNVMNRLSEDMLRYPGQLEQLNKYNDFVSQLNAKDIKISPEYDAQLKAKFGLKSTSTSEANAQSLADQHIKMSHLYDARDNMIDNYQKNIGKNQIQEAIARNPIVKAGINVAKKVIPFGIGTHL